MTALSAGPTQLPWYHYAVWAQCTGFVLSCQAIAFTQLKCYREGGGSLKSNCYRRGCFVPMSIQTRREYVETMRTRYQNARSRQEKTAIADELVATTQYHRKHAIRVLKTGFSATPRKSAMRAGTYVKVLPTIAILWEALDYCCAERLHPQLVPLADQLVHHGVLQLPPEIRQQLESISRSTLARRLSEMPSPNPRRRLSRPRPGSLVSGVPIDRYAWDEGRPGALEVDLVEHGGGASHGHYAYTLSVVDIVSGWSRRQAVMGRGQKGVFEALSLILDTWPTVVWGLHSDNGSEFLNGHLKRYTTEREISFTRSRPYQKNDNAHVEQRNGQYVRQVVGYARYDAPEAVDWLNDIYALLDPYANLILPSMKVTSKVRNGAKVRKTYDTARSPLQRLVDNEALNPEAQVFLEAQARAINPLTHRRELEDLIERGPYAPTEHARPDATPTVVVG